MIVTQPVKGHNLYLFCDDSCVKRMKLPFLYIDFGIQVIGASGFWCRPLGVSSCFTS